MNVFDFNFLHNIQLIANWGDDANAHTLTLDLSRHLTAVRVFLSRIGLTKCLNKLQLPSLR